ncbi:MAG: HAMP domain-containing histidine kinase [Marmoricola sp.]|nr:HAMP domain-containing histidine kinase [Marmoricola sp.]
MSSVRVRVTLAATAAALVAALLGSGLFLLQMRRSMESQLVTAAKQQIAEVQAQLHSGQAPRDAVITGKGDVIIQLLDGSGNVVATDHPRVTGVLRRTAGIDRDVRLHGLTDHYLVVAAPVRSGPGLIVVGLSTEQVNRAAGVAAVLLGVGVPIGLALVATSVWLAVGRALRPVDAMRAEAETITAEHLSRRLAVPGGDDEIPRLAITLNEMLDRIDASSSLQRQFVSDASHELRSPLTTLRQLAEVARDYPDRTDQRGLADDVLAEERRMEELVAALLLLARMDDAPPPTAAAVDLDDLVLGEARRVRDDGGPHVDVSGVSAGQVAGDRVLLAQVVGNLLSNARRHARSEVALSLQEYGNRVVLTVDDDGDGIPPEDRERVFERFVRLDEARDRDAGGSGLGLAIVDKVVHGLGGDVRVQESAHGGARFVVTLPAATGS